ncbi:MAG: glycosyltransferase [Candidatus Eisenbacteria bacterium]|uniref:Glycosyltransferase n=1 Tax=Eiseniibacteriota bacterium TaxID=2212470 RepID=A0A948S241_UNCEI|nr:glycosyltransferase [Candidatus Eisenbacteria bacterium]MBU1947370.1 glycosyltransferase [Candidatus Eisenbacteria bacterium]MBU2692449.1 glycosyltransferase [Candidatus Eisenbacteria bacterium]
MKVALVHDWLTGMRGGEKCLEVLCEIYPEAPIYTLVYRKGAVSPLINSHEIRTSFIQNLPRGIKHYRWYLPLFPAAIERFDLRGYDLIISTSHCVAKGVIVHPESRHLCYCHTPIRYIWGSYEEYFGGPRSSSMSGRMMTLLSPWMRVWDVISSRRVDHFVANSHAVAERIRRYYDRTASVVHPWVDTDAFQIGSEPGPDAPYLILTALVPYKKTELAITAATRLGRKVVVVGEGPERRRLERLAGSDVRFLGWLETGELRTHYRNCRALLFPGEEDFGIVPLEAMACGRPVIAYGRGGALETVVDGTTGIFFNEPTPESLSEAILKLESMEWDSEKIRERALAFSRQRYRDQMETEIEKVLRNR